MKKVLNLCVIMSLVISLCGAFNVGADEPERKDASTTEEITLVRLGILDKNTDFSSEITRSDTAIAFYKLNNYEKRDEDVAASGQIFTDINMYNALAGYVEYLYNSKIITGYGDGTYRPDDKVYAAEAYAMALRSAGYGDYIAAVGEYSDSVSIAALKANFRTDISFAKPMTYGDLAKVLYKLMFIKTIEVSAYEKESVTYDSRGLFINEKMKLDYGDGIVSAFGKNSINGIKAKKSGVIIDGVEYSVPKDIDYIDYPGKKARYYYDDEKNIAALCFDKNQEIYTFRSDEITFGNGGYKTENGKKYNLEKGYQLVYNERFADKAVDMVPKYGYVILIDADGSGRFETVHIYDFGVAVINYISKDEAIGIKGKNGGREIYIAEYDEYTVKNESGKKIDINGLLPDFPCLIAESTDKSYILILPVQTEISGTVAGICDDKVKIDDKEYKLSEELYSEEWHNEIGINVTAYKDFLDNIIYVKREKSTEFKYGFVIKSGNSGKGVADNAELKLLQANGEIKVISLDAKVKIDGKRISDSDKAQRLLNAETVIRYKENNNVITEILRSEDCDLSNTQGISENEEHLLRRASGTVYYRSRSLGFKKHGSMAIAGDILPDSDMVVFAINPNSELPDEERYTVVSLGRMNGERDYEVDAFNANPGKIKIDALLLKSYDGVSIIPPRYMIADKIKPALNDKGDTVNMLCGYHEGSYKEYVLKDDSLIKIAEKHKITQGDIIAPKFNMSGEIISAVLLYSADGKGTLNRTNATDSNFNARERYISGLVQKRVENSIIFKYENDEYARESFNIDVAVYQIDMSNPDKKKRITVLDDISQIMDIETYSKSDKIIIQTRDSYACAVTIIKE